MVEPSDDTDAPRGLQPASVDDPRPGELTAGWAVVFGLAWLGVGVAMAAVWTASRQLGLSTWWLGPAADPRPIFVNLLPFVAPIVLVAGSMNRLRYLPWWGAAGAAVTAAIGLGDLGRVRGFGIVELLIAAAAAAVSLAALAGMYRTGTTTTGTTTTGTTTTDTTTTGTTTGGGR